MKKLLFALACICIMTACNSKKVEHESPKFLTVVDSICNKYTIEDGYYDIQKVISGMHGYMNYCLPRENPIYSDLPFTLDSYHKSIALDGRQFVSAFMSYDFSEPMENGKRIYHLHVIARKTYGSTDSIPLKEGDVYYLDVRDAGIGMYDGNLDLVGVGESQAGGMVDSRCFGTIDIDGVDFIPVE